MYVPASQHCVEILSITFLFVWCWQHALFCRFLVVGLERQVQRKALGFGPFTYVHNLCSTDMETKILLMNQYFIVLLVWVNRRVISLCSRTRAHTKNIGSCSASILAIIIAPAGPLVLMSSTVSGISFLGAGALIKSSDGSTQGFTTGSLLVLTSFIGICMGSGMYLLSLMLCVPTV